MKKPYCLALALLACTLAASAEPRSPAGDLKIFFIDVEGGQSTLFIAPSGESLLIDTGWPGNDGRDARRIADAAHRAGITHIDFVLLTHYHVDHAGGIPQLVARIPVGTFLDHGPNREFDHGVTEKDYAGYQQVLAAGSYKHLTLKPGDHLPISALDATVISSDGNLITQPLPGAGLPNPFCDPAANSPDAQPDLTENARSLGLEINFGPLRILDLGDLTRDKERLLMCPVDRIGPIDLLVVSHHGWYQSSSAVLIDAIHPRIAVMDNGAKKGGSLVSFETLEASPGLESLWQLHFSDEAGILNSDPQWIANLPGVDAGYDLEVTAHSNGSFEIFNARTGLTRSYPPRL